MTMERGRCRPNIFVYTTNIDGLCKGGLNGYEPNTITVSTVNNGLCKTGNVRDALQLFRNMDSRKCMLDAYTCNTVISGFCKEWFVDEA
ncbi:hypothetical protein CKAN_01393700 [Cinnamomum micranthum f. kanehirae]|uniref:Pentatricopeptide repeat-containing protein n=1 Tax=Cinnamomum micranthum f. kanehirae TaxID=337451 RepID=A0A3S3QIV9_9MAGN|nr:hypothetical protein CKAN_01393700 [Cinnamomum micranthum f. kanehirae]